MNALESLAYSLTFCSHYMALTRGLNHAGHKSSETGNVLIAKTVAKMAGMKLFAILFQHSATSENRAGGAGGRGSSPTLPGAGFGPIGATTGGFGGKKILIATSLQKK